MNGHKMVTGTARMDGQKMLSEMPALLFAWSHPTHQVITKLKRMVSTTHQVITKLKRMVAAYVLITAESHNMVSKPTGRKRVHCDLLQWHTSVVHCNHNSLPSLHTYASSRGDAEGDIKVQANTRLYPPTHADSLVPHYLCNAHPKNMRTNHSN